MAVPVARLYKTIFEVRYKAKLKFYNLLMPTVEKFDTYPHWETNLLAITLRNYDDHCSLHVKHNRFGYEQDSGDEELDKNKIEEAISRLPPAFGINNFSRVGYRRLYLIPLEMKFNSLVTIIYTKLYSQDSKLQQILPKEIKDLMYRIDSLDTFGKYHFTMGAVKKAEIPKYINYNKESHLDPKTREQDYVKIYEHYPEISLFIDVDTYRDVESADEAISLAEVNDFIEKSRRRIPEIVVQMSEYLFAH